MAHIRQKDIAKVLKVSRITVSKALRDSPDISRDMKQRVNQVAKELGYIPHYYARNLHFKRTNTIGVVIPDVANSFFSFAIHGIMDTASKMGYQIILTVSRESAETEQNNIMTLLSMRVDGLLVAISKDTQDKKIYETAKKVNTPLVFFDRAVEGVDFSSVGIDDRRDAAKLVEYAIQCGYTKIAHLSGSQKISIGKNRYTGYMDMIKKYKLPVYPDWIVEGGFDKQSGYDGFKALYRAKELPQLVFAANDRVAQGAYKAIKEKGLQIPEQIGVIAFGHSEFAELLSPSLTIVDCPPDVLGRKAMELLNNEIENPENHKPKRVTLETRLRINESTLKKI